MSVTGRDLRIVDDAYTGDPDAPIGPPELDAWVRFRDVPDDQAIHAGLLAQFTGHMPIAAALRAHAGIGQDQAHVTLSTAINAISLSLHADVRADRWMLYHHRSTFAGDGMTHAECRVHDEGGLPRGIVHRRRHGPRLRRPVQGRREDGAVSLTTGRGPLGTDPPAGSRSRCPAGVVYVEPHARRVQGVVDGRAVIDTERALLVHRAGPHAHLRLPGRTRSATCPREPEPEAPGYVRVPWDAVDAWYEEGRKLVHYPPNPYHRVDCRPTKRRLRVEVAGTTLVDTDDTIIVFETSLAPKLYVAPAHVRTDLLRRTETTSYCNYKGDGDAIGRRWSATTIVEDVAWSYEDPLPESIADQGLPQLRPDSRRRRRRAARGKRSGRTSRRPLVDQRVGSDDADAGGLVLLLPLGARHAGDVDVASARARSAPTVASSFGGVRERVPVEEPAGVLPGDLVDLLVGAARVLELLPGELGRLGPRRVGVRVVALPGDDVHADPVAQQQARRVGDVAGEDVLAEHLGRAACRRSRRRRAASSWFWKWRSMRSR